MKKIITVVGARPQFIKLAPVSKALRVHFKEVIVHTGQHYDYEMSKAFFDELGIPDPDYNLEVGSGPPCWQMGTMMMRMEEIVLAEKPDLVLVFGDTNSTAAASIVAAKHRIKLAHVEAGLREFDKTIPEETNKLITDILCDFYFCPTQTGVDILSSMGIHRHVYNVGDVMIDLLVEHKDRIEGNVALLDRLGVSVGKYAFMTCHRAANTDVVENLKQILEALAHVRVPIVFPIHPRTRKVVEQAGLQHLLELPHIHLVQPMGYFDSQTLIRHAAFVITDSGGVTKEAYFHQVQGILLDTQTEWVETVREGWNLQCGPNTNRIVEALSELGHPKLHSNCLGDGRASQHLAEILVKEL